MLLNPKVNRSSLKKLYLDVFFQFFLKIICIYLAHTINLSCSCSFVLFVSKHIFASPYFLSNNISHCCFSTPTVFFLTHILLFISSIHYYSNSFCTFSHLHHFNLLDFSLPSSSLSPILYLPFFPFHFMTSSFILHFLASLLFPPF